MSAAQSEITMEDRLGALQCHFTWDLDSSRSKLFKIRDKLQDIGTDEGNKWLGHIYNLQGYVHFQLGSIEEARSFFSRAAEAFRQIRNTEEGPWLEVNYGNQAWLHHHQGEHAESRACLSKIDGLSSEYPSQEELHPEICAEKAWTLMKFSREEKLLAADYFQRAIRMQPDVVEWQTSHVIGLVKMTQQSETGVEADVMEKLREAKEQDPENLYLAVLYLWQLALNGEVDKCGAQELATKVLRSPVSSYSGILLLLRFYRIYISLDEALALAEEALMKHPDERLLKGAAAGCYKWAIWEKARTNTPLSPSLMVEGIRYHEELISLYPDSSFKIKLDLASICAKSPSTVAKSDEIFQQLLAVDLEASEKQLLFNKYAKHVFYCHRQIETSIEYHMKAVEIPNESPQRKNSIETLEKIRHRSMNRDVDLFLSRLREEEALEEHPDERLLKGAAACGYKRAIWEKAKTNSPPSPSLMAKGIRCHEELISLYPDSSFKIKLDLASICSKSPSTVAKSDEIFQQLLAVDLEASEKQLLFNRYAKHLFFCHGQIEKSIEYHMKAVEIPNDSPQRQNSIEALERIRHRSMNRDVDLFLSRLKEGQIL